MTGAAGQTGAPAETEATAATAETKATGAPAESGAGSEPLVIYSDAVREYDFGPEHPLTPLRFGPSIDLIRACGAHNIVAPRIATDDELARLHTRDYISTVRRLSDDPWSGAAAGIGPGDTPRFDGMHDASARVAGGSLDAADAILRGAVEHAFNPGGGLHHAFAGRAAGFCVYNDVALGVARARDAGHRVLYVDLDVHHGDGTQALFWDDPEVLTFSIHESGRNLFPGTGFVDERGGQAARGTAVNVPLEIFSGDGSWIAVLESALPALAEAFRPTFLVTQHGCDTHAYDPLAHLRLTTRAYRAATLLLDRLAHEHCSGRWLATGGGGYDAYRVVPRSWSLVWLAQAHRAPPETTPAGWRDLWSDEAARFGQSPLPEFMLDPEDFVPPESVDVAAANARTAQRAVDGALELLAQLPSARESQ